jgi:hypothetical protein
MRAFRLIAIVIALGAFLSVPTLTSAASDYSGYIACGWKTSAPKATSCPKSGRIGAFFRSKNATVQFKTCVKFPNGEQQCTRKSTAEQGFYYVNHLTVGSKGTLTVKWKVDGVYVKKYTIQVT